MEEANLNPDPIGPTVSGYAGMFVLVRGDGAAVYKDRNGMAREYHNQSLAREVARELEAEHGLTEGTWEVWPAAWWFNP